MVAVRKSFSSCSLSIVDDMEDRGSVLVITLRDLG